MLRLHRMGRQKHLLQWVLAKLEDSSAAGLRPKKQQRLQCRELRYRAYCLLRQNRMDRKMKQEKLTREVYVLDLLVSPLYTTCHLRIGPAWQ